MNKLYLFILFSFSLQTQGQTALSTGDIAFTGYNCDDNTVNGPTANDDLCFILLKNISANTVIYFTDFGWRSDANAFQSINPCGAATGSQSDGILKWTATSNMTYGTQIRIRCKDNLTASAGIVSGVQTDAGGVYYLSLATGGDQLFAYQGSFSSPVLLAGISANGSWDATLTNCTFTSTMSTLPSALSPSNCAVAIVPEVDNARLKASVKLTGNLATDRAAINNPANWEVDDLNALVLPASITFLPVVFTYIRVGADKASIEWGVATEENVRYYRIQYSKDGLSFSDLSFVSATGKPAYRWPTTVLEQGYYRIISVDFDDKQLVSRVLWYPSQKRQADFAVFFHGGLAEIRMENLPQGLYNGELVSTLGALIAKFQIQHAYARHNYSIQIPKYLPKGVYIIHLSSENLKLGQKVFID